MAYGYVSEHRKVAWDTGMLTDPIDHVHHRNGDKQDNRAENLEVLPGAEHARLHHTHAQETYHRRCLRIREELGQRSCIECGADITSLRIDAVVCGATCRLRRWKRQRKEMP
jgi:hypothetical protein